MLKDHDVVSIGKAYKEFKVRRKNNERKSGVEETFIVMMIIFPKHQFQEIRDHQER